MRNSAIWFMHWMHCFSIQLEYEWSVIRYILWEGWTLPTHSREPTEYLIRTKLTVVTLDNCESGTHVIAKSMKFFRGITIFSPSHQKFNLKPFSNLILKQLDHVSWSFIQKQTVFFEHFIYFLDSFIFIRLEYMSKEKCLLVTWLHNIINHQVALVKQCKKLIRIWLNFLFDQLGECFNVLLQLFHSKRHKIDHLLCTVLDSSIIELFITHSVSNFGALCTAKLLILHGIPINPLFWVSIADNLKRQNRLDHLSDDWIDAWSGRILSIGLITNMEAVEASIYMERAQPAFFARTLVATGMNNGSSIRQIIGSFALLTISKHFAWIHFIFFY